MAKYLRKKRPSVVGLILVFAVVLLLFLIHSGKKPVCEDYQLSLPEGYVLQQDSKTEDCLILRSGDIVGGVLHCPFSKGFLGFKKPPQLYPMDRTASTSIIETLKAADAPGTNPVSSDYMDYIMESGDTIYSCVASFINRNAEYYHYMIFFKSGILTLWFDTALVDSETIGSITSSFSAVA